MFIGLLWLGAIVGQAAPRYVVEPGTTGGTNTGPFTDWAIAATQIQWAVDVALINETVWVSNGTYNLTNQINITNAITVQSVNGTNFTFINGNYPDYNIRCVYMTNGVLDGFTVSNGFLTNGTIYGAYTVGGAGIGIRGPATVKNCYIYRNYITNFGGGGIHVRYASGVTISNCTVVGNICATNKKGGGIYLDEFLGSGLLIDSYISGNIGGYGGGVCYEVGAGRITNCTIAGNTGILGNGGLRLVNITAVAGNLVISNNTSYDYGAGEISGSTLINSTIISNKSTGGQVAGIAVVSGSLVSNCQVIGNSAASAGGFYGGIKLTGANNSTNVVANCIIANNYGVRDGGLMILNGGLAKNCLIYNNTNNDSTGGSGVRLYHNANALNTNCPYGLINCTIVDNRGAGPGIYTVGSDNYAENCIVVSNVNTAGAQANINGDTAAATNNYWHTCTPNVLAPNQGNITGNPLLVDRPNRNYRLGSGSPGINAGTNQSWMTGAIDLDGHRRLDKFSGQVDMGCYEYVPGGTMYGFR